MLQNTKMHVKYYSELVSEAPEYELKVVFTLFSVYSPLRDACISLWYIKCIFLNILLIMGVDYVKCVEKLATTWKHL